MNDINNKAGNSISFGKADLSFLRTTAPLGNQARLQRPQAPHADLLRDQLVEHRLSLEMVDMQVENLERTIAAEQRKVEDDQLALDESLRIRARLLELRQAMLDFVVGLEKAP